MVLTLKSGLGLYISISTMHMSDIRFLEKMIIHVGLKYIWGSIHERSLLYNSNKNFLQTKGSVHLWFTDHTTNYSSWVSLILRILIVSNLKYSSWITLFYNLQTILIEYLSKTAITTNSNCTSYIA